MKNDMIQNNIFCLWPLNFSKATAKTIQLKMTPMGFEWASYPSNSVCLIQG
jgi:hypothetical protein